MRTIEEIKADIEECSCFGTQSKLDALWLEWFRCLFYSIEPDRLSEICQAEREQRFVVLPCKVGDTVWCNDVYTDNSLHPAKCHLMNNEPTFYIASDEEAWSGAYALTDFGVTVFLTYEAAEAARKEDGK